MLTFFLMLLLYRLHRLLASMLPSNYPAEDVAYASDKQEGFVWRILNIFQEAAVQQFLYIGSFWGQVQLHFSPKHSLIFHISFFFILFFPHFQCSLFNKVYNTERAAWKPLNGWHNSQSTYSSIIFIFLDKCTGKFLLHKGISYLFIN